MIEKKINKTLTNKIVEDRANEFKIKSPRTIRYWLNAYLESGYDYNSLIPKYYKSGNRSNRLLPEVEEIIQTEIANRRPNTDDKSCWKKISDKCEELGYSSPSLSTISRRIKQVPATERFGTQGGYMRYEVRQSVQGKIPRGDHPLAFIQVDSTPLDVFVKDPLGKTTFKPHLTLYIDVRTRMIYSWWLDSRKANSVDVNRGLVRGFLPKDGILKQFNIEDPYPIYGIPLRIQFDNAKEYDTKFVKDLCFRQGVEDYQFRMVKRADKGTFVERMFKTINKSWLPHLPGYAPPLKERPLNIPDPEKTALKKGLTFPKFEEWLIKAFIKYHNTPHSGLYDDIGKNTTPMSLYLEEMENRTPRIPKNPEILQIEVLKFKESILQATGIQFENNFYNKDGRNRYLLSMRKRNQGKKKKVFWRYDPADITSILVYDEDKKFYFNVGASRGILSDFVQKHSDIPVRLSTLRRIRKHLKDEGEGKEDSSQEICRRLEREMNNLIEEAQKCSKKRSVPESTIVPKKQDIEKPEKEVKIDWDNLTPLPSKPMGKRAEWESPASKQKGINQNGDK